MKKEYVAPELHYESYVLSESIAAGCGEIDVTNMYIGLGVFSAPVPSNNQGISSCANDYDTWVEQGIIEEYCYFTGSSGKLFLS